MRDGSRVRKKADSGVAGIRGNVMAGECAQFIIVRLPRHSRHKSSGSVTPEGDLPVRFFLKTFCIRKRKNQSGQMSVQSSNYWSASDDQPFGAIFVVDPLLSP